MKKKIAFGALGLVVLLGAMAIFLGSNLDRIVKAAIETYGSQATGADVSVAKVEISPRSGEGVLEGFRLTNPEGFTADSAIKVGRIFVKIDPKSLLGNGPVIVKEIAIDSPMVTYEIAGAGESNLQKIQNNATAFAAPAQTSEPEKKAEPSRGVIIKRLIVKDGEVRLSHELLKGDDLLTVKLPLLQMANIGDNKNGASPAIVARAILDKITSAAISVGQSNLVKKLRQQGLDSLKSSLEESEIGKGVTNALDDIFSK